MAGFAHDLPSCYPDGMTQQEKLTSMNVSLPESMRAFAEERARQGYTSASEYIRELIRRDQKETAKEKLEALLIEGMESGDPIVVTADYWENKRQELKRRLQDKKAK